MTICLAVLCENSHKVVVAADRMVTASDTEFEQDIQKVNLVTDHCAVLSAGSALRQVDLIRGARGELHINRNPQVINVVAQITKEFVEARRQKAEELHLRPLGLNFEQFLMLQDKLSENLILRLTRNIETEILNLELIVAGVDSSGGHIYYVCDPGTSDCFDGVGFCAIGSGEHHAELTFIRSNFSPGLPLNQAVFLAYQAKRDAEMAPGVGARYTDIGIIDENGLHFVSDKVLAELNQAYVALMKCHTDGHNEARSQVDALKLIEE